VDYIFTEYLVDILKTYTQINFLFENMLSFALTTISTTLPFVVKYLIGYCHFYYQLGYGLVFYIYFFRRYKAKKTKNWQTFYGNSILNWVIFNLSIFNKVVFTRNFLIYIKSKTLKSLQICVFLIKNMFNSSLMMSKLKKIVWFGINKNYNHAWTPLFKRSSYISFTTFLKRFTKRK
jgi:hypothetical protein